MEEVIDSLNRERSLLESIAQLKEIFMLKQIDKNTIKESSKYFDEVRKIKDIENKNIVKVNYATYDDDNIYISMPYYKNGSLQDILQNRNLTVREIVKYSLDILSGIYYIHKNQILHCDIKPSNILIDDYNCAVLADFGSSININSDGVGKLKMCTINILRQSNVIVQK